MGVSRDHRSSQAGLSGHIGRIGRNPFQPPIVDVANVTIMSNRPEAADAFQEALDLHAVQEPELGRLIQLVDALGRLDNERAAPRRLRDRILRLVRDPVNPRAAR